MTSPPKTKRAEGAWKQAHPTVSFRVSLADREWLNSMAKSEGKTLGELLHIGLGLMVKQLANGAAKWAQGNQAGFDKGYKLGFEKGWADSRGKFELPCSSCGKPMELDVSIPEQLRVVKTAFANYRHTACPTKVGYSKSVSF